MSEILNRPQDSLPPEHREQFSELPEFRLIPFDAGNFPDERLTVIRSQTTTTIKESLQDFTRLESIDREFREESTHGDYIWSIIADLGMTEAEYPTKAYRQTFAKVHEMAKNPKDYPELDMSELLDKYEEHPAVGFIDTLDHISSRTNATRVELVMLRRSMLILLDEAS